ncbi:MAG: hypothetical protein ABDI20_08220 [Candidatus Bipolaricaulaceae bacterium]
MTNQVKPVKDNVIVVYRDLPSVVHVLRGPPAPVVLRTGFTGPPGPQGLRWRGEWDEQEAYAPGDIVRLGDELWVAGKNNTGQRPGATDAWELFLRPAVAVDRIDGGEL